MNSVEMLLLRCSMSIRTGGYRKLLTRYQYLFRTCECPVCLIITTNIYHLHHPRHGAPIEATRERHWLTLLAKCRCRHSHRSCSPVITSFFKTASICFASWNASSRLLLPKLLTISSIELLLSRAQCPHLEIGDYRKLQTRYQFLTRTGECPICLSHIISITFNTSGTVHQLRH